MTSVPVVMAVRGSCRPVISVVRTLKCLASRGDHGRIDARFSMTETKCAAVPQYPDAPRYQASAQS